MFTDWHEEPIRKDHNGNAFDCGEPELNGHLQRHARQNHDRGVSKTILAVSKADPPEILGYYTLSPASVEYARVPEIGRRGLGRYDMPVFRLGRLAVDVRAQGQELGGQLLFSAARRCTLASTEVGGVALLIDAKNERVAAWYARYGAYPLLDSPLSLLISLTEVAQALRAAGKL